MGHIVELPNSYYEPDAEKKSWELGEKTHSEFKARMFKMSEERIKKIYSIFVPKIIPRRAKKVLGNIALNSKKGVKTPRWRRLGRRNDILFFCTLFSFLVHILMKYRKFKV